jgi:predicted metalloprotease with PDZ domain
MATLEVRPAHLWQSAEESSLDAWFEGLSEYRDPARSISYYNKGQILGVMLDLAIRDATDNHKSLDDVMRRMYEFYGAKGRFYDDSEGIRAAVEEVAGKDFHDFFAHYVAGTEDIPYGQFLSVAGLTLNAETHGGPLQYPIAEIAHPTDRQRRILDGLLHGTTD